MHTCKGGCHKLNAHAFGAAIGAIEALAVLAVWVLAMAGLMSEGIVDLIGAFYVGFDMSLVGLVIGLVEALIVGFLFGYVAAWVYNWKVDKLGGKKGGEMKKKASGDSEHTHHE